MMGRRKGGGGNHLISGFAFDMKSDNAEDWRRLERPTGRETGRKEDFSSPAKPSPAQPSQGTTNVTRKKLGVSILKLETDEHKTLRQGKHEYKCLESCCCC
jgi:hypothetical protein